MKKPCAYCHKKYEECLLKPIPHDDSPHLNRKYCERCFPDVLKAHRELPWNRDKWWAK